MSEKQPESELDPEAFLAALLAISPEDAKQVREDADEKAAPQERPDKT